MAKRMRLPNGFGQISELRGRKLRNKWRAMVTTGWTNEGKPIRKTVGYYHTYNEAYSALMEYHKNPNEQNENITLAELYEEWSEQHYKTISKSTIKNHRSAWKYCEAIYNLPVKNIKVRQIKEVVEADMPPSQHARVKNLLSMLFDRAVEYEYADKNYARIATVYIEDRKIEHHIALSDEEVKILWKNTAIECVRVMLIQCYTGFRPDELFCIDLKNVDIDNWFIIGGKKTEAGTNRPVPIHSRIKPFVLDFYNANTNKLFGKHDYNWYLSNFSIIRDQFGLNPYHKPHDGRVTFVTNMKRAGADEYAIKRIVGHAIKDLTEKVYTERDLEWLRDEIEKLP